MAHERSFGHTPIDVSAQKKGWDIESRDGAGGPLRLIEVKGRHADARDVIITKNEILRLAERPRRLPPRAGRSVQRIRAPARLRAALLQARAGLCGDGGRVQSERPPIVEGESCLTHRLDIVVPHRI